MPQKLNLTTALQPLNRAVCEKDFIVATAQEMLEICEDNPEGVAQYLHDLIYDSLQ